MPPVAPPAVRWVRPEHLAAMYELEQAAARSRTRLYEGSKWKKKGFADFLQAGVGAGLVACAPGPADVLGFALYAVLADAVEVVKFVAPARPAEDALLAALWESVGQLGRRFLNLPLVLELGPS